MTPEYPASIKNWTHLRDLIDDVLASQMNEAYDEITAIQQTLGINPQGEKQTVAQRISQDDLTLWDLNKNPSRLITLNSSSQPVMPDCPCLWWFAIPQSKNLFWDTTANQLKIQ